MRFYKIDLHGLSYEDARRDLIRFIEPIWGEVAELEIVTGYSHGMRLVVFNVLHEYDLAYQIGRPYDTNQGYIVSWLD